jgi:hypothetical protein
VGNFAQLDPDPADQNQCGIRIRNTVYKIRKPTTLPPNWLKLASATCHTERRMIESEGREVAIIAVLAKWGLERGWSQFQQMQESVPSLLLMFQGGNRKKN